MAGLSLVLRGLHNPMAEFFSVTNEAIDPILAEVVMGNQDKVIGWMKGEPGAWGFLAGQAVSTVRGHADRTLADGERRLVWSRMWWCLEQVKAGNYGQR